MRVLKHLLLASAAALSIGLATSGLGANAGNAATPTFQHVLLVSVDGMHAVDLQRMLAQPGSNIFKTLSYHGTAYPKAFTTAPSDSFPGMVAQVTGATPKTAGVFYDDSYDRTFFAPSSGCAGQPGAETTYAENIDVNQNKVNAGGKLLL